MRFSSAIVLVVVAALASSISATPVADAGTEACATWSPALGAHAPSLGAIRGPSHHPIWFMALTRELLDEVLPTIQLWWWLLSISPLSDGSPGVGRGEKPDFDFT
ncbi:hypothetical protein F4604DRAFT_1674804 [Suillus subluteus]|nr:hypothetical protein F4604DRAFT_1674804 [Suillus subluteus]